MANSVMQDRQGPDWPLGLFAPTPGTPVNIMSLVDSANAGAPNTATAPTTPEYANLVHKITFWGVKAGAGPPSLANNTGLLYIVRVPNSGGAGNATDKGAIVAIVPAGGVYTIEVDSRTGTMLSPYRYLVDVDTAGDGALVTAFVY